MSEHHPGETMAFVALDPDPAELSDELIDELLVGARTLEELIGRDGLLQRLTKRLVERAVAAEWTSVSATSTGGRRRAGPVTLATG